MNSISRKFGMTGLLLVCLLQAGCYYAQAVRGQLEILGKREPISEVLDDPGTPEAVAARLRLVADARDYSVEQLGLPDNDSYRSYADLERDYVVWNIFAAPEFSLAPKQWCYPVVGCVAYRGYFRQQSAETKARRLEDDGFDVFVGGVAAYSTLGRFDDPVLNTMLDWDDVRLVSVLFHELAHQVLYIRDDTAFNESFATAVEEVGVERYLADRGMGDAIGRYRERQRFRVAIMALIEPARVDLEALYAQPLTEDAMRRLKAERIDELTADFETLLVDSGRDPANWLRAPFNNARLASFSLYRGRLPAFRTMLEDCAGNLDCFYAEASRIAALDRDARDAYLDALATR